VDIYEMTNMLTAVELLKPSRRFFLDRFFSTVSADGSKSITFDVVKGSQNIAPYVSPRVAGKVMQKSGYKTMNYSPAYVKPKIATTAGDFLRRQAGEVMFGSSKTPDQRAAEQLIKELMYCDDIITRRLEQMCSEVVQTGKLVISGDDIEDEIDFLMDPDNLPIFSGTALWTAHTIASPITDFRELKMQAVEKSGVSPTDVILGSNAYKNFLLCDEIRGSSTKNSFFDLSRVQMGQINPKELPNGITYVGNLTETGMDLWTYTEYYMDEDSKTRIPMVKPNNIILGSVNGEGMQCYGAIEDVEAIEAGLFAVPRYPKVWVEKDPSVRMLMVQCAPLIVPKIIDSWVCAQVC
jgi:hypothetical protein